MLDIDGRVEITFEDVDNILWNEAKETRARMKEALKELKCAKRKARMAIALHEAAFVPIGKINLLKKQTNHS